MPALRGWKRERKGSYANSGLPSTRRKGFRHHDRRLRVALLSQRRKMRAPLQAYNASAMKRRSLTVGKVLGNRLDLAAQERQSTKPHGRDFFPQFVRAEAPHVFAQDRKRDHAPANLSNNAVLLLEPRPGVRKIMLARDAGN